MVCPLQGAVSLPHWGAAEICRRHSVPARPAWVTTLPQRAISEAMKRSSSSDEAPPPGIMPSLMICCCTSGSAITASSATLSLVTISFGVPGGTREHAPAGGVEAGHADFGDRRQLRRDRQPDRKSVVEG